MIRIEINEREIEMMVNIIGGSYLVYSEPRGRVGELPHQGGGQAAIQTQHAVTLH